jgi:MFS family permease
VCQALASGLGGYLGYVYDRALVTAAGCFIWGMTTLLFSCTTSVGWGAFVWAWNGVGLSFIIPNSQSLVADYYTDADRGRAFGAPQVYCSFEISVDELLALMGKLCEQLKD